MAAMDATALQAWVAAHVDSIFAFMDYEATIDEPDEVRSTLEAWLDNSDWSSEDRFVHLGIDGTGGQFLEWVRAEGDATPVVLFGSEGGFGVLTATTAAFALALAHRPWVDDYEEPASLTEPEEDADEDAFEALAPIARPSRSASGRYGRCPSSQMGSTI